MIKPLIMFIFGNALWDKLVEIFGSTEAVVEVTIALIVLAVIVKYFKVILGVIVLILILSAILSAH